MNEFRNKSLETLAIQIGSQVFSVAGGIILARSLGTYGKGVMTYVVTVSALLVTLWAGQSNAISWQYSRLKTQSGAVAQAMLRILFFGALTIALLVLAWARLPDQWPLVAVAASLPFSVFSISALGFFLADKNVRVANVQTLIMQVGFNVVIAIVLLIGHRGLDAVLVSWVAVSAATAAYTGWKLRPYLRPYKLDSLSALIREQITFGIKASLGALVWLLNSRVDVFIIIYFLGLRALGIYSVGLGLAELMLQLRFALMRSAFGRICTESQAEAAALTAKCARHVFVMCLSISIVIFLIGPTLITYVFGSAFASAGPVVRVLLPGMIAYSMMPFFGTFFVQQLGKPGFSTTIGALSIAVCAAVTVATIHTLGIVAGALGTTLSYSAAFFVSAYLFSRRTNVPISKLFLLDAADWRKYHDLYGALKAWAFHRKISLP